MPQANVTQIGLLSTAVPLSLPHPPISSSAPISSLSPTVPHFLSTHITCTLQYPHPHPRHPYHPYHCPVAPISSAPFHIFILTHIPIHHIVSVHCREEGCIGKYIPRGPREISRAEGGVFPNASRLEAVYVHSLSISREVLILWCVCHLKLERSPS